METMSTPLNKWIFFSDNGHAFQYLTTECLILLNLLVKSLFANTLTRLPRQLSESDGQELVSWCFEPSQSQRDGQNKSVKLYWALWQILPINCLLGSMKCNLLDSCTNCSYFDQNM